MNMIKTTLPLETIFFTSELTALVARSAERWPRLIWSIDPVSLRPVARWVV